MQPCGRDRIRLLGDGSILLSTRLPKGWVPRVPGDTVRSPRSGTAVAAGEELWEVLDVTAGNGGSVLYRLAPWPEDAVIRDSDRYDVEREEIRAAEAAATARREKASVVWWVLSLFAGHLPARRQSELENEYGLPAARMTLISCAVPAGIAIYSAAHLPVPGLMTFNTPAPLWVVILGVYSTIETVIRVHAVLKGAPMGTVWGVIFDGLSRRPQPSARPAAPTPAEPLPVEQELEDRYHLWQPLFSFLTEPEQAVLTERFGFDAPREARRTAVVLLLSLGFATLVTALTWEGRLSQMLSIVITGGLAAEQIYRLHLASRHRAAPGVLGVLVRPLARPLLEAPPRYASSDPAADSSSPHE